MVRCERLLEPRRVNVSIVLTMPDDQRQWCVVDVVVAAERLLYGTGQRGRDKRAAGKQQLQLLGDCHCRSRQSQRRSIVFEVNLTRVTKRPADMIEEDRVKKQLMFRRLVRRGDAPAPKPPTACSLSVAGCAGRQFSSARFG